MHSSDIPFGSLHVENTICSYCFLEKRIIIWRSMQHCGLLKDKLLQ